MGDSAAPGQGAATSGEPAAPDGRPAPDEGAAAPDEFEQAVAELERIVQRLDREELGLDEALALFEAGIGHLRTASRRLEVAEGAVEELIESAAGELASIGFDVELPGDDPDGNGDVRNGPSRAPRS